MEKILDWYGILDTGIYQNMNGIKFIDQIQEANCSDSINNINKRCGFI